jgi:hypothetical protein
MSELHEMILNARAHQAVMWNDPNHGARSGRLHIRDIESESGRIEGPLTLVRLYALDGFETQALARELTPPAMPKIQAALRHIQALHPEVDRVSYGDDLHWCYGRADGKKVIFDKNEDLFLLEQAADEADSLHLINVVIKVMDPPSAAATTVAPAAAAVPTIRVPVISTLNLSPATRLRLQAEADGNPWVACAVWGCGMFIYVDEPSNDIEPVPDDLQALADWWRTHEAAGHFDNSRWLRLDQDEDPVGDLPLYPEA